MPEPWAGNLRGQLQVDDPATPGNAFSVLAKKFADWGQILGGAIYDTAMTPLPKVQTDEGGRRLRTTWANPRVATTEPVETGPASGWDRLRELADYASMAMLGRGGFHHEPFSKVMEGGKPKRVYRGTTAGYDVEDPMRWDRNALYGPGGYFTESPEVASGYSKAHNLASLPHLEQEAAFWREMVAKSTTPRQLDENRYRLKGYEDLIAEANRSASNVRASYLDIINPFDADAATIPVAPLKNRVLESRKAYGGQVDPSLERLVGRLDMRTLPLEYGELKDLAGGSWANNFLRRLGYDGITHIGGGRTNTSPHRVWITFSPDQEFSGFTPLKDLP